MPAVPAEINLNFASYYAGTHRICFREVTTPPTGYDCTTVPPVTCLGGGSVCAAIIPIMVNNDSCDPVTYEGYVQPTCVEEGSLDARTYWSVVFTPNPTCKKYSIECTAGIVGVTVDDPGRGYTPGATLPLLFTGGSPAVNADIDAVIGNGGVKTFTLTSGGGGYDGGASGSYSLIGATGGSGAGATFEIVLTAGVVTSAVLTINSPYISPGTGYLVGDTLIIPPIGGTGAGATISVDSINTGEIQYLVYNNPGSGYTSVPTVTVPFPATTPATFFVTVSCTGDTVTGNCNGEAVTLNDTLGGLIYTCSSVVPSPSPGYTVTQAGCCYSCATVVFTNGGLTTQTIYYIDCFTLGQVSLTLNPGDSNIIPACAVNNSWYQLEGSDITASATLGCAIL